jgi:hypothetical protein
MSLLTKGKSNYWVGGIHTIGRIAIKPQKMKYYTTWFDEILVKI